MCRGTNPTGARRRRAKQPQRDNGQCEAAAERPTHIGLGGRQKGIRPHQRYSREEIVVQQPTAETFAQPFRLADQVLGRLRTGGVEQIGREQKARHLVDVLRLDVQCGFLGHTVDDGARSAALPTRENLELAPPQAIKSISRRIMQCPRRRAIERHRTGKNSNVFAQCKEGPGRFAGRCRERHHNPIIWRAAAMGRRNR